MLICLLTIGGFIAPKKERQIEQNRIAKASTINT